MNKIFAIIPRNIIGTVGTSECSIDFDVSTNSEIISSIAVGCAIDGYNYITLLDTTGTAREFTFDFSNLRKTIEVTSVVNFLIRIMDVEGNIHEKSVTRNYATENGYVYVANPRISMRADGSRLVDIMYDYYSPREMNPATVSILLSANREISWDVPIKSMVGDIGTGIQVGSNRMATWDPSIDYTVDEPFPLTASINLSSSFGDPVAGILKTGTIMVYPTDKHKPSVVVSATATSSRWAMRTGNICKIRPTFFNPIGSSSSSSLNSSSSSMSSASSEIDCGDSWIVSDFGTSYVNGTYVWDGTTMLNGKRVYLQEGGIFKLLFSSSFDRWTLTDSTGGAFTTYYAQISPGCQCPDSCSWRTYALPGGQEPFGTIIRA